MVSSPGPVKPRVTCGHFRPEVISNQHESTCNVQLFTWFNYSEISRGGEGIEEEKEPTQLHIFYGIQYIGGMIPLLTMSRELLQIIL